MIEEVQVQPPPATPASTEVDIKVTMDDGGGEKKKNPAEQEDKREEQSDLSQYFGQSASATAAAVPEAPTPVQSDSFFDQLGAGGDSSSALANDAILQSCHGSKVDLTKMNKGSRESDSQAGEAIVDVVEQSHDDDRSLRRRQSVESHPLAPGMQVNRKNILA